MPFLSICIPAFNKPEATAALLKSIFSQNAKGVEVVTCEDNSPERKEIRRMVEEFKLKHKPVRVNWLKGNLIIHIRIPRRTGKLRDRQVQRTIHPERIGDSAQYEINGSTIKVRQNGN